MLNKLVVGNIYEYYTADFQDNYRTSKRPKRTGTLFHIFHGHGKTKSIYLFDVKAGWNKRHVFYECVYQEDIIREVKDGKNQTH